MSYSYPTPSNSAYTTGTQPMSNAYSAVRQWSTPIGNGHILRLSTASPNLSYISSLPSYVPGHAWPKVTVGKAPQYILTKVSTRGLVESQSFPLDWLDRADDPLWFKKITQELQEGTLSDVYFERLGQYVRKLHETRSNSRETVTNDITHRGSLSPVTLRDNEKNGFGRHSHNTDDMSVVVGRLQDMTDPTRGLVVHPRDLSLAARFACWTALSIMKRQLPFSPLPDDDLETRFYVEKVTLKPPPPNGGVSASSEASIETLGDIVETVKSLNVGSGSTVMLRAYPIETSTSQALPGALPNAPHGPIGSGERACYTMSSLLHDSEPEPSAGARSDAGPIGHGYHQ